MLERVSHGPCPKCRDNGHDRRGDNLATYADGHSWCYCCGYYIPSEVTVESIKEKLSSGLVTDHGKGISLPADANRHLYPVALAWLGQYKLTSKEIGNFLWSESEQQLIYVVWGECGEVVFWQGRNFGEQHKTKYYTCGPANSTYDIHGSAAPLILVEDVVSAIKVARVGRAMPLFSGSISKERLIVIRDHIYSGRLGIWLDRDKLKEAIKIGNRARELGFDSFVISTAEDPKAHSTEEIRSLINGQVSNPS